MVEALAKTGEERRAEIVERSREALALVTGWEPGKLDPRWERFCIQYLVDGNSRLAAKRAGFIGDDHRLSGVGMELLLRASIRQRIRFHQGQAMQRAGITVDRIVNELGKLAFADIRDVMTWDDAGTVSMVASDSMSPEHAAAIESIKQTRRVTNDGTETITLEAKLSPKLPALRVLASAYGIDRKTLDINVSGTVKHEHSAKKDDGVSQSDAQSIMEKLWGAKRPAIVEAEAKEA